MMRVNPDGSTTIFASLPQGMIFKMEQFLSSAGQALYGSTFLGANFCFNSQPNGCSIFGISSDGQSVTQLASGLNGLQLSAQGPRGNFGDFVYIASDGLISATVNDDGGIFALLPDGTLSPFVTGLDATDVIFDTQEILGGGMFIADQDERLDGSKQNTIWRVTPIPEPGSLPLFFSAFIALLSCSLRKR